MRDHVGLGRIQLFHRLIVGDGQRHSGNRTQRGAVAGVQILRQPDQRPGLCQDGVRAGRIGVVYHAGVRNGQPGRRGKLCG